MQFGYDYFIWLNYQLKQVIQIELQTLLHLLLTGASGSGKSYALKYLIEKLLINSVELTFCNFKKSADFRFLENYANYFTYLDCANGLHEFYRKFKEAQDSETEFSGKFHILIFDEFPAFILSTAMTDKKVAEQYKQMISEILMLGRSYGFGIWLIMQRPDASFFANGARDNFHITVTLGNISKEAKSMLYSGEELPDRVYRVGEGVAWIDGIGLIEIKFPKISSMIKLESKILQRL